MSYEFTGKVVEVTPREDITDKFYKRLLVLDDEADKYPQQIPFECANKACDLLDSKGIRKGDKVTVTFDLRGRAWKDRWFGSNNVWKLERLGEARKQQPKDDRQQDFDADDVVLDEEIPF